MQTHFLEIVLQEVDLRSEGSAEIQNALNQALGEVGVGEVTGGSSGGGEIGIEVVVVDLDKGLAIIRRVLQGLGVAGSTAIDQYEQQGNEQRRITHLLYE